MPKWSNGNLKSDYHLWEPKPTSKSAQFIKLVELCGGVAPSSFFYDNSMISNLCAKAGYLKREGKGCELTTKGKSYLATHKVELSPADWLLHNSKLRYRGSYRQWDEGNSPMDPIRLLCEVVVLWNQKDVKGINTLIRKLCPERIQF